MLCIIQKYIYTYSRNFKMWMWTKAAKFKWVDSYGVGRKEVGLIMGTQEDLFISFMINFLKKICRIWLLNLQDHKL